MRRLLFHHPLGRALAGLVALGLTACGGGADQGAAADPVARSAALEPEDAGAGPDAADAAGALPSGALLAVDDGAAEREPL